MASTPRFTNRQTQPGEGEWGGLGLGPGALRIAASDLIAMPEFDAQRVCVMGHSRNGKTALWAGAQDERFALVVSDQSGCGGAALSRAGRGEQLADINTKFPSASPHAFTPSTTARRIARGSASTSRPDRAASAPGLQRAGRSLARIRRGVRVVRGGGPGLPVAWDGRLGREGDATGESTGQQPDRLPHPSRQTRRDRRRLEGLLRLRGWKWIRPIRPIGQISG